MKQINKWIVGIGIIIVLGLLVTYFVTKQKPAVEQTPREAALEEMAVMPTTTVNVKHQYKDGVHTFAGAIETPTPCYDARAIIVSGDVNEIQVTTEPQPVEVCAQVLSEKPFMVTHTSPADAQFLMTVNGELVNMNQFDIDPDIDINTVDILIKG